jgi:hypothetical protein
LARTVAFAPLARRLMRTNGVLPMESALSLKMGILIVSRMSKNELLMLISQDLPIECGNYARNEEFEQWGYKTAPISDHTAPRKGY